MTRGQKTGVIGDPVNHSLSPLIHNYWLEKYDIEGAYDAVQIKPENLKDDVRRLFDSGYRGLNVTVPHKQMVMGLCDTLDGAAEDIKAVNTLVLGEDGKIEGRNTDALGFVSNLHDVGGDISLRASSVLVLGAGGAARAVVYALKQEGVPEIKISNRTLARADILAADFGAKVIEWDRREKAAQDVALLVNTTTLGMKEQEALDFDVTKLPKRAWVYDLVYSPLTTPLLQAAQDAQYNTVDGLGMLLHQARPAFEAWYGVLPDVTEELKIKLQEALS